MGQPIQDNPFRRQQQAAAGAPPAAPAAPPAPPQQYAPPAPPQQYAAPAPAAPAAPVPPAQFQQPQYAPPPAAPIPGYAEAVVYAPPAAPAPQYAQPPAAPVQPYAPPQAAPGAPAGDPFAAGGDAFGDPAAQEARGPRLPDVYGRLLLIVPKRMTQVQKTDDNGNARMVDRMISDVWIIDPGPIYYGGKPEAIPPVAHTKVAQAPMCNKDMWLEAVGIISQAREQMAKVQRGERGMVLGRLVTGEAKGKNRPPWLLQTASDADKALARQFLMANNVFGV